MIDKLPESKLMQIDNQPLESDLKNEEEKKEPEIKMVDSMIEQ